MIPQSREESNWKSYARVGMLLAALLAGVWLFSLLKPLITALLVAAMLAYLLNPLVRLLNKRLGLRRQLAVKVVFWGVLVGCIVLLAGLGLWIGSVLPNLVSELQLAGEALERLFLRPVEIAGYQLDLQLVFSQLGRLVAQILTALPSEGLDFLFNLSTNILWGLVILTSTFYILRDAPRFFDWLVNLPPREYRHHVGNLLAELDDIWGVFLRVQIFIFFVLAVLFSLGTALVIWLFRSALLEFSPLGFILLLVLVYTLVQQVDNLWLRPQLMGQQLRMHPGVVFAGLTAALVLGGFLGAFLIVPLIASARVVGRYVYCMLLDRDPYPEHGLREVPTLPHLEKQASAEAGGSL